MSAEIPTDGGTARVDGACRRTDGTHRRRRGWAGPALAVLLAACAGTASAGLEISEFMAANATGLRDENGDASDWIEVYNAGTQAVSLAGWHLTDSAGNLTKWTFPATNLAANGYLVVFASNKNRATAGRQLHTNFRLDADGEYLALVRPGGSGVEQAYAPVYPPQVADVAYGMGAVATNDVLIEAGTLTRYAVPTNDVYGTNWYAVAAFDDSAWAQGATGVGAGFPGNVATDIAGVMRGTNNSIYLRLPFSVSQPTNFTHLSLEMKYDDGFAAYLNGSLAAPANVPADLVWNASAATDRSVTQAVVYQSFTLPEGEELLAPGTNVLAIHGLNREDNPRLWDFLILPRLLGHYTIHGPRFFLEPSPGAANPEGGATYVAPVTISPPAGYCTATVTVTLAATPSRAAIRYTLDGSVPTAGHGMTYSNPIALTTTTVVRAVAFDGAAQSPAVATATYLIGERYALPVVAIVGEPDDFWGPAGLYTVPRDTATEKPAHVALFETNGAREFAVDAGVDVHGGYSENFSQKSLSIHMRSLYGDGRLNYRLFPDKPNDRYNNFLLRNAGTDWGNAHFRDALIQYLGVGLMDIDYQAYRPTVLLVNGQFVGIQNLREKLTKYYPEDNYGANPTNLDLIKYWNSYQLEAGNLTAYYTLRNFVATNDMSVPANYAYVQTQMDVDNFLDYQIVEIFSGNIDWPQNNMKFWRERKAGARWRWIFMDVDYAFSLFRTTHNNPIDQDSITRCTTTNAGTFFIRHDEDTLLIRRLLDNADFRNAFIQRFAGHLNVTFAPDRVIGMMNAFQERLRPEMPRQIAKYAGEHIYGTEAHNASVAQWDAEIAFMRQFSQLRPDYVREDIVQRFELTGISDLTVRLSAPGAGLVIAANVPLPAYPFTGRYFNGVPVPLQAVAAPGYRFVGWQGALWDEMAKTELVLATNADVTAVFEPLQPSEGGMIVSEAMFHPRNPPAGVTNWTAADYEFVELSNTGAFPVDLEGWRFSEGIDFEFPALRLEGGQRVVVVANRAAFATRYSTNGVLIAGPFSGNLDDGGERVTLEGSRWGPVLATFQYNDARGWPDAADGAGHSLVPLVTDDQTDGRLDYGGHWRASAYVDGSPGAADPEPAREAVLNEIVAHTDLADTNYPGYDSNDWLELYNPGTSAVSFVGWHLSDDGDNLRKWAIPATNTLAPGAWIVFDEISGFHRPITNGFGLNKAGETVFLSHLPGGGLDRVVDAVRFKGQENGVSLGRYRDGGDYWYALTPPTPWAANVAPTSGVCIGEFLYHPATTGDEALVEFVEVHNAQSVTAALWNADGAWRLDGGVSYTFPAGVALAPNERLVVVGFDPVSNASARAAFLANYAMTNGQARLYGPYDGQLDNRGERLALEKPLAPDLPEDPLVWVIVDEVIYFDNTPWPAAADGTGRSLARAEPLVAGRDPANWYAAWPPTPGVSAGRIALAAPEGEAVVFAQNDEPLRAVLESGLVAGSSPQVAFYVGNELLSTDGTAPFTGTLRLPAAGRYALRAELTDAAGVWTSRTAWVTALALSNAVVTAVDDVSASVVGGLEGAVAAAVRLHWGPIDGGTSATAWASFADLGTVSNAAITAAIGSLLPGRTYALRFSATAGGRTGWSPASTLFATPSYAAWPYSTTLRFPGYTEAETLRDFPALVRLGTNLAGFTYSQCGGSWASLRFADEAGATPLAYEVDVWDTHGESAVWVRVPALTNDTVIRAYWGLAGMTNPSPLAARGGVWREDDEAVWHWQDDLRDSTWRGRESVNGGSVAGAGIVGAARAFDGVDDALDPALSAAWYGTNLPALTVSLWANPAVPPRDFGTPWGSGELYLGMNTSPRVLKWTARVGGVEWQGPAYATGAWQMVSLVLSNGAAYLQKNDEAPVALGSYTPFTPTNAPVLGLRAGAGNPFAGRVDEVRLSRAARSAAWLRAAYRTVALPGSFTAYGPVITATGDADGDGLPDAWERLHFVDTARDGTADWDADGMRDGAEFVAGTEPTNALSRFALTVALTNGTAVAVGFQAILGEPGSEGLVRFYTLESATGLSAETAWWGLPGYTNLQGLQGGVWATNPAGVGAGFYRGRVWLEQ